MTDLFRHIFAFDPDSPLLFTQFYFWAFFAIVYAVFSLLHSKRLLRNTFLLFVSLFFYYKSSGLAVLILLFVTCSDYLLARLIYRAKQHGTRPWRARFWLIVSVMLDLGLLCYFKYAYFFTNMLNDLLGTHLQVFDIFAWAGNGFSADGRFAVDSIVLPVGISFYIFQVISYTADVYYGKIRPVTNLLDFGFYVSFFPQLVAGPIVRASEFIPQLYRPFRLSRRQFGIAVFWILNGLIKKIILSDYLAVNFIDRVFQNPLLFSGFENLSALFFYSLQVYADFSGYTDIAIGVAMLMGFFLPKNFNSPYKAANPQDFWRRWHMSLSRWLKNYLYIPLGGNRNATFGTFFWIILIGLIALILTRNIWAVIVVIVIASAVFLTAWLKPSRRKKIYANLNSFITMLLGGLWHGASWNFMIWGGLNGAGMIAYKGWKDLNWHLRMLSVFLLACISITVKHFFPSPLLNILTLWLIILSAGTLIRYIYHLIGTRHTRLADNTLSRHIATAFATVWAVAQTFTFITFTRLFFRSGSNLDPALANQEAWLTATNMVHQIGSTWNLDAIPHIILQYANIYLLFIIGMLIHWLPDKFKQYYRLCFARLPLWLMVLIVVGVVFIVYQFITADLQSFIYFQF